MSNCEYIFKIGKRKGEICGLKCRNGNKCGKHTEKTLSIIKAHYVKNSLNPEFKEKKREYMKNRREVLKYKEKS